MARYPEKHDSRPLSPHIQIYRPQLTSVLSIANRITGVLLSVAAVALVFQLVALAEGPEAYSRFRDFVGSSPGLFLLLVVTFSFYLHLFGGIRHLMWDTARGLELRVVYLSGWLVVFASVLATAATWLAALSITGLP